MAVHLSTDPGFWDNAPTARRESHDRAVEAGWAVSMYPMGPDPDADDAPLATLLWIAPGDVLPRHTHECYRVEVIVKGSLDVGGQVRNPGDVTTSEPNEFYGPHTAGPEGCLSVEIFSRSSGLVGRTPEGERTRVVK